MSDPNTPRVTVLMPVYNGESYLREAIESILEQTYTDFEFLIINDGSTDKSVEIVRSYKDSRIRLVQNENNIGLINTLNKGIDLSTGQYIARMDCDDISLPARIEKQVLFMENHPDVGVCGTWAETIGNANRNVYKYPTGPQKIQSQLLFDSPLAHPSVMMRKTLLDKFDLRYPKEYFTEDWYFWQMCSFHFPIGNIPEVLLEYRINPFSKSRANEESMLKSIKHIDRLNFENLQLDVTPQEADIHRKLGFQTFPDNADFIKQSDLWLNRLKAANHNTAVYPEPAFSQMLAERLFTACTNAAEQGFNAWNVFRRSPLSKYADLPFMKKIKFAVKCAFKWRTN